MVKATISSPQTIPTIRSSPIRSVASMELFNIVKKKNSKWGEKTKTSLPIINGNSRTFVIS